LAKVLKKKEAYIGTLKTHIEEGNKLLTQMGAVVVKKETKKPAAQE